jgi:hypothetical protein
VRNCRKHYLNSIKNKRPALSAKRVEALRSIGFDFDPTGVLGTNDAVHDKRWKVMFDGLNDFHKQHGSFSVPVGYLCDGRSLLDWLRHQRSQFINSLMNTRPALSNERRESLLSIGFDLDPTGQRQDQRTEDERWAAMLQGLEAYSQLHGTFVVPEGYSHDNRSLFSWARNQRRLYNTSRLPQDRVDKLREIGFIQARCSTDKGKSQRVVAPPKHGSLIQSKIATRSRRLPATGRHLPCSSRMRALPIKKQEETASKPDQVHPSWVVLALDSLTQYQNMSPHERSKVTK